MGKTQQIKHDIVKLIDGDVEQIEGRGSVSEWVEAMDLIDPKFNRAFSSGGGASFKDDGSYTVDGFGIFKYLQYETHPYINVSDKDGYLLKVEGSIMDDYYEMTVLREDTDETRKTRNLEG